ncbi:uncharacterized protein A4U43_C05F9070 [Asparagus officinalis]|uniref:Uncharacterized protein n=1 Tax=Asparagus officinalis TaxID=4686 RepID=A0A5P1EQD8_ASPOF|nr:uncharacterized protein A4U43_C05F9070 [Asparagus officinalis]
MSKSPSPRSKMVIHRGAEIKQLQQELAQVKVKFVQNEIPGKVQVAYSRAPVDRHNYYGHEGTHDPEVAYAFDGNVLLFLKRKYPGEDGDYSIR